MPKVTKKLQVAVAKKLQVAVAMTVKPTVTRPPTIPKVMLWMLVMILRQGMKPMYKTHALLNHATEQPPAKP